MALLALALSGRAHAQPVSALPFTFKGCGTLPEADVRRIAGIELGRAPHARAAVEVQCGETLIEVRARQDGHAVGKTMQVSGVDDPSRARLIALAAAELVLEVERLSRAELEPPHARPLPAVPVDGARYRILAGFTVLAPLRGALWAFGPSLSLDLRPRAFWALSASIFGAQGERAISGGDLRLRTLMGELGVRGVYPRDGRVAMRGYAQLSVLAGVQELHGAPSSHALYTGDSFRSANVGARLAVGGELDFARHGVATLEAGLARYARTLEAHNEIAPTTEIGPWFASLTLSLGVRW